MNIIQKFEQKQLEKLTENKKIPDFRPGDTVKVIVRIVEGANERNQAFEGVCIARKNNSINSSFTLRKISNGEGVERVFPTFSPLLASIELVRKGDVRRAKLYYMRGLTGKKARIKERIEVGDEQSAEQLAAGVAESKATRTQAAEKKKAENAAKKAAKVNAPAQPKLSKEEKAAKKAAKEAKAAAKKEAKK